MSMMGININDKEHPWTEWILDGRKTIETRKTPSLDPYLGKMVGLIRTGKGQAELVGFARVDYVLNYLNEEEFDQDHDRHQVGRDSKYHWARYGYRLTDVVTVKPEPITSRGIVARKIR